MTRAFRGAASPLLWLTLAYLVFELSFSARLLDAAATAASMEDIQALEQVGRTLSGIALGLVVAGALLAIVRLFLPALSVQVTASYMESITFHEVMKIAHNGAALDSLKTLDYQGAGIWSILMVAALLASVAPHFYSGKYLKLGYAGLLAPILIDLFQLHLSISADISKARDPGSGFGGAEATAMAKKMMGQMLDTALKAISLGLGFHLAAAIAVGLAFIGIRNFLVSTTKV